MKPLIPLGAAVALMFAGGAEACAQAKPLANADVQKIYEKLLKQIDQIPIYDNHSHATFPDDSDMDAMASPPDESTVMRLRDTNPEFVAAAKALFGYPYDDFKPEHAKWLIDKKKAAEAAGGTAYWDSILDKLNIETCLANRVALAPYLDPKRFHWVFFVDSFLFPFDNHDQEGRNGDMGVYIPLQEKVLQRYMEQEGVSGYEVRSRLLPLALFSGSATGKGRRDLRQISFRRSSFRRGLPHLSGLHLSRAD
jgi:hypothetical protein